MEDNIPSTRYNKLEKETSVAVSLQAFAVIKITLPAQTLPSKKEHIFSAYQPVPVQRHH